MPASEMESLRRSVSHWGMVEPLVVRRSNQLVIGGNQRLETAKALGMAAVPVVYVELSDAEAKALNLALNRIRGEWDLPKLGELLEDLQRLPEIDESLTGFSGDEIDALLAELDTIGPPIPGRRASRRRRRRCKHGGSKPRRESARESYGSWGGTGSTAGIAWHREGSSVSAIARRSTWC